jgi:DNA repair protein RadD
VQDLRDYQRIAVRRIKDALVAGKRPVLQAPTGSGKTVMAEALIQWALNAGHRALFVANRISLVDQAAQRFGAYDPGLLQSNNSRRVGNRLLVASIQTAMTRMTLREHLTSSALVIIDECHAVPGSKQYREFLSATPGRLCGLSATPWSKGLGKHFNELIVGATVPQLIAQGYLVDCDAFVPDHGPDLSAVPMVAGDFHEGKLAQAMNQPTLIGGIVEHWLKLGRGMPTLLFAVDIAHSQSICQRFREAGVAAEHIDAFTDLQERLAVFRRFEAGETKIICNCAVLAEGIDLPLAQCMILARPTRSMIRHIQQAGRILRPFPGKDRALILDHSDTVTTMGPPTHDLTFPLDSGKEKVSVAKLLKEEGRVDMTTCSACGYVKPVDQRRCENCGHTPQKKSDVQYVPGSLRLLQQSPSAIDVDTIRTVYRQLLGYARSKGKKDGFAFYKTQEYFRNDPLVLPSLKRYKRDPLPPSDVILRWIIARNIRWAKRRARDE